MLPEFDKVPPLKIKVPLLEVGLMTEVLIDKVPEVNVSPPVKVLGDVPLKVTELPEATLISTAAFPPAGLSEMVPEKIPPAPKIVNVPVNVPSPDCPPNAKLPPPKRLNVYTLLLS